MPKTIKNDRVATWEINGDNQTWTLEKQASITVNGEPAIHVLDTSVANRLKLLGDIVASGDGGQGVLVSGVNTRILLGKDAEIDADEGIHATASGLEVTNRGEINALGIAISNTAASTVKNLGDISGETGISTLGTSKVINGADGMIQGDFAGVNMAFGSNSTIINHGLISGNDFAVRLINGGENSLINTGTIHGDILFGLGDDLFDTSKGVFEGTVTGGDGSDFYRIGKNSVEIVEDADEGVDVVYATISHDLNDNVEALYLLGKKTADAHGNDEDNILSGNRSRNTLQGGEGDDTIMGGRGDDAMSGDDGLDTFVFKLDDDHDIIVDFEKGEDTITLMGFDNAANFTELQTEMFKNGSDVWIQLGGGDRLIIMNTEVSDLDASDFNFVT